MTPQEIFDLLNLQFPDKGLEYCPQTAEGGDPFIKIPASALVDAAWFLKKDPRLDFKMLHCLSGVDYPDRLSSVVHLFSFAHRHSVTIKTDCSKDNPAVPSLSGVWAAANWHERESFDLIGIQYEGHPNLKRILLSEDWDGHPLRKDYVMPDEALAPWDAIEAGTAPIAESNETLKRPESN